MISRRGAEAQRRGNGGSVACGDVDEPEPWRCPRVGRRAGEEGVLGVAPDWFADMHSHGTVGTRKYQLLRSLSIDSLSATPQESIGSGIGLDSRLNSRRLPQESTELWAFPGEARMSSDQD